MHAGSAFVLDDMRAELVEQPEMRTLGDVVIVHRPEYRTERIGIGQPPVAAGIAGVVAQRLALLDRQLAFEETGLVAPGQFAGLDATQSIGGNRLRVRNEAACEQALAGLLDTENRKGVAVRPGDNRLDIAGWRQSVRPACRSGRARLPHQAVALPG